MIEGVSLKVCGITTLGDAQLAISAGADYLGFILYPKSPRYIAPAAFMDLRAQLPAAAKTVGVIVNPGFPELEEVKAFGFDYVQVQFPNDTPFFETAMWTEVIPPDRLWLAPRVPPGSEPDPAFFPLADTLVVDAFDSDINGVKNGTCNWDVVQRLKGRFTKVRWVLAGGLGPDNIGTALKHTGVTIVEVNSGVESAPGVKDAARLDAVVAGIRSAVTP